MKKLCLGLIFFFGLLSGTTYAEPSAFVTNPADIRFIQLREMSKFLENDLDIGKGIVKIVGKKVIDHKFRKAGIPDPAKKGLEYCIVAREMDTDKLNLAFILKGDIDIKRFLRFADKRYVKYFKNLKKLGIECNRKTITNRRISGKKCRVYPFAFRNSESIVLYFDDYTIIATIPHNNTSLIKDIIKVLTGKQALSKQQPRVITFMSTFIPNKHERKGIRNFENQKNTFINKVRNSYKKIIRRKEYNAQKLMDATETKLKLALSKIEKFSYQIEASKDGDGYAYDVNLIFKCTNVEDAKNLKELTLAWLAYTSSKTKSNQDMVSFKSNKVLSSGDTCVFSVKLGSSPLEQYQFSSLIITLMMQDRRFRALFKS